LQAFYDEHCSPKLAPVNALKLSVPILPIEVVADKLSSLQQCPPALSEKYKSFLQKSKPAAEAAPPPPRAERLKKAATPAPLPSLEESIWNPANNWIVTKDAEQFLRARPEDSRKFDAFYGDCPYGWDRGPWDTAPSQQQMDGIAKQALRHSREGTVFAMSCALPQLEQWRQALSNAYHSGQFDIKWHVCATPFLSIDTSPTARYRVGFRTELKNVVTYTLLAYCVQNDGQPVLFDQQQYQQSTQRKTHRRSSKKQKALQELAQEPGEPLTENPPDSIPNCFLNYTRGAKEPFVNVLGATSHMFDRISSEVQKPPTEKLIKQIQDMKSELKMPEWPTQEVSDILTTYKNQATFRGGSQKGIGEISQIISMISERKAHLCLLYEGSGTASDVCVVTGRTSEAVDNDPAAFYVTVARLLRLTEVPKDLTVCACIYFV